MMDWLGLVLLAAEVYFLYLIIQEMKLSRAEMIHHHSESRTQNDMLINELTKFLSEMQKADEKRIIVDFDGRQIEKKPQNKKTGKWLSQKEIDARKAASARLKEYWAKKRAEQASPP